MSNLGWYQVMTTAAKKVGGPQNLFLLTLSAGGVLYKGSEVAIKQVVKKVKNLNKKPEAIKTYTATANGKGSKDLILNIGDTYRILETDGESVLMEKIGDSNNPYFVSADFLRSVSDFIATSLPL